MEMVDRYIYAVTKRLPEKQREDIEKELRGLIEDMLEERSKDAKPANEDFEAVLKELGNPSRLADQYRGKGRYLIGPEYFDKYITVLKIVLAATAFGLAVALTIGFAVAPPNSIASYFGDFIGSLISGLFQAFTFVTLIFAALEFNKVNVKRTRAAKEFNPSELPKIPGKDIHIKRSGPIVSIIFSIVFLSILNFSPQIFGIRINGSGLVPIFNLSVLHSYILLINISFLCIILKQILQIVYGRYGIGPSIGYILLSLVTLIITIVVFTDVTLWNPAFVTTILNNTHVKIPAGLNDVSYIAWAARVFIGISIFAFAVETIVTVVKTVKYEMAK